MLKGITVWSWRPEFPAAFLFLALFSMPLMILDVRLEKSGDEYLLCLCARRAPSCVWTGMHVDHCISRGESSKCLHLFPILRMRPVEALDAPSAAKAPMQFKERDRICFSSAWLSSSPDSKSPLRAFWAFQPYRAADQPGTRAGQADSPVERRTSNRAVSGELFARRRSPDSTACVPI